MLEFNYNKTIPGIRGVLEDSKEILWWGLRDLVVCLPGIIVNTARWNNASSDQTVLPQGLLLGKIRSTGFLKEWEPTATDGSEDIFGVLAHEQNMTNIGTDIDRMASVIVGGPLKPSGFYIDETLARGINGHAQELLIRTQLQNRAIFDDNPEMTSFGGWRSTKDKTADYTIVEADHDTLFTNLAAAGEVTFTLPTPREGFRAGFFVAVGNKITVVAASGTPIIADGDATRDTIDLAPEIGTFVEILGKDTDNYIATLIPGSPVGVSHAGDRYRLDWVAGAKGLPAAAADRVSDTGATSTIADPDFILVGTNHSTGDAVINPEGGVTIETDGATNDQEIVCPHTTASVTGWTGITWGLDRELEWECQIRTVGAVTTLTDTEVFAGLKLTNDPSIATDANQVYFFYSDAHGTITANWIAVTGAGEDAETDTGVVLAADTNYHLRITIDPARIARFYINGELVHTSTALTSADLIPYIGIEDIGAGAAKSLIIRGQSISRAMA